MVIFQYNLYIFGIHLWTVLYTKPCYNEPCYKEVVVYITLDKRVSGKYFSYFSIKAYIVGTQYQGAFNEYPQCMLSWRNKKNINNFWLKKKTRKKHRIWRYVYRIVTIQHVTIYSFLNWMMFQHYGIFYFVTSTNVQVKIFIMTGR